MQKLQYFLIAAAVITPSLGYTSPVPSAGASFVVIGENFGFNVGGLIQFETRYEPTAYGYVDVSQNPLPSVTLDATAPNGAKDSLLYIDSSAVLNYYFSVSGPDASVPIPVNISGISKLNARAGDFAGNLTNLLTVAAGTLFQFSENCGSSIVDAWGTCGTTNFSGRVDAFALPDADYMIQLIVNVYGQFGGGGNAYLDPFLEIDPAWSLEHPGYSLAVSDGFGNEPFTTSAVPEPSTYALMLSGLALLGAAHQGRKSRDAVLSNPKVVSK